MWGIGKNGWRKCKYYTLYSVDDTFEYKLKQKEYNEAFEYLHSHAAYISKADYEKIAKIAEHYNFDLEKEIAKFKDAKRAKINSCSISSAPKSKGNVMNTMKDVACLVNPIPNAIVNGTDVNKRNNAVQKARIIADVPSAHERGIQGIDKTNINDPIGAEPVRNMSALEFRQASWNAYLFYMDYINGKKSVAETIEALAPLMALYGFKLTPESLTSALTVCMTRHSMDKCENARVIRSISTFRWFIKGGYRNYIPDSYHGEDKKGRR